MNDNLLEKFAELFIKNVRDRAIEECDNNLVSNSPIAQRWNKSIQNGDIQEFAKNVIADSVDISLFYALLSVDDEDFDIIFKINGVEYRLGEKFSGELGGYYTGLWVEKFSNQRFYNDLPSGEDLIEGI